MHFASFLVGLSIGAVVVIIVAAYSRIALRKSDDAAAVQARSESQVALARATERENAQLLRIQTLETQIGSTTEESKRLQSELTQSREEHARAQSTASIQADQLTNLGEEVLNLSRKRDDLFEANGQLQAQIAELTTKLKGDTERITFLQTAREELTNAFKSLAGDILEEKSQRFTNLNKDNMAQILDPLKSKIQEFQTQVQSVYTQESSGRAALGEQVRQMMERSQQLSEEANNLAKALKGSNKELGNWGEMVLERMLEESGLRKGTEYLIRPTYIRQDLTRAQPDAVILLPEGRNLVIDSKASLAAYDEYVRADDEASKAAYLDEHADALRKHLAGLSITDYQKLPDLNSPDFIVMFVPIEPGFIVGVRHDKKLWQDAWNKNVLMVSPTSLFFVIRIVKNLWTQDAQKKNFQEIARRGGALYDKFVGFIEDMEALGKSLRAAENEYESAFSKFCKGKGNVIRQAEMLRNLGVTPSKLLRAELTELASEAEPETSEPAELQASD